MNIKTADHLMRLRKEKGYTQESLADALGISRQAVSKWERAEACPDTDNLIALAQLYGVSLDELLDMRTQSRNIEEDEEIIDEEIKTNKKGDKVYIGSDGIHVHSEDGDEIHIDSSGIHLNDVDIKDTVKKQQWSRKDRLIEQIISGIIVLIITAIYLFLGFKENLWHPAWIIFILISDLCSIPKAIIRKKISYIHIWGIVLTIYLYIGFTYELWHPYWLIFIIIPVFSSVIRPIGKLMRKEYKIDDQEDNDVIWQNKDPEKDILNKQ